MRTKRPPRPLDADALRELALRYVGRYATSRAKLLSYLDRKLGERGFEGDQAPDVAALVEQLAALGYVDDAGYAAIKAGALTRRGYGVRRVNEALKVAGIEEVDRAVAESQALAECWNAADRFARRKRIGPYAAQPADRAIRDKHLAAFLRAGHSFDIARRWVAAAPGEPPPAEEG